ncbi:formylglycine-generating enzyme family protein [Lysobacter yangpyeongensis]|uniref:Formylglycine-generating enzyme family protein n=1 Tax=Lysobacter yangpyeongensis TaxID=346182 RepID=A0ABW0SHZ3_9GAMM
MRRLATLLLCVLPLAGLAAGVAGRYAQLPGGSFRTALKYEDRKGADVRIAPFAMMTKPVTNAEFLAFVQAHPQWRRDRVAGVFAEPRYLSHWQGATQLGSKALPEQPVTWVSWFAANAYCESQGARLPTWSEWEYAAAADETRRDARSDPAWRERILVWYSRPSTSALPRAGLQAPNAYGVQDLHGLVWEWTDDYSSLLVSGDNRNQGDADRTKFCGAGALSMDDRENYAVLMRVAMLSSLEAHDATANLGFRCARSAR